MTVLLVSEIHLSDMDFENALYFLHPRVKKISNPLGMVNKEKEKFLQALGTGKTSLYIVFISSTFKL